MAVDPGIINAITAAVEANPDNVNLRLHLAGLLLDDEKPAEALNHLTIVLGKEPDNVDALVKAARAARAAGEESRAQSFQRLHDALVGASAKSDPSNDWIPDELTTEFKAIPERKTPESPKPVSKSRVPVTSTPSDDEEPAIAEIERPRVTLADVAGMESVKRRLNLALLAPLKNPEMMKLYGKSVHGGLLLYGPPGCGKTFIARATSGELGAKFISVGLSDVLDMWLGNSERNIHEIFETARRNAPCVLFFDEIDALGRKRSLMRNTNTTTIVNQLLAEMDSVGNNNQGVFILAATNQPWDVDTALRRPGRLDRTLLVLPPDALAREAVLRYHLRERPVDSIDYGWLTVKTDRFSGADIAHLCESAAELAMEDSITSGQVRLIKQADFKQALKELKPSTGPWFEMARNYAMYANEGGQYDDLLAHLRSIGMK